LQRCVAAPEKTLTEDAHWWYSIIAAYNTDERIESIPMRHLSSAVIGFYFYYYRSRAHRRALSDPG